MNVSLTPQLEQLIREKVESGRYNNASEVVREGLRLIETRDQKLELLRAQIQEGLDQIERGEFVVADDDYFDQVRADVKKDLANERQAAEAKVGSQAG